MQTPGKSMTAEDLRPFAILFFAWMVCVCLFCARDTTTRIIATRMAHCT